MITTGNQVQGLGMNPLHHRCMEGMEEGVTYPTMNRNTQRRSLRPTLRSLYLAVKSPNQRCINRSFCRTSVCSTQDLVVHLGGCLRAHFRVNKSDCTLLIYYSRNLRGGQFERPLNGLHHISAVVLEFDEPTDKYGSHRDTFRGAGASLASGGFLDIADDTFPESAKVNLHSAYGSAMITIVASSIPGSPCTERHFPDKNNSPFLDKISDVRLDSFSRALDRSDAGRGASHPKSLYASAELLCQRCEYFQTSEQNRTLRGSVGCLVEDWDFSAATSLPRPERHLC